MTDLATNLTNPDNHSIPGTHRPSNSGEGIRTMEWSFDLDDAVVSDKGAAYNGNAPGNATTARTEHVWPGAAHAAGSGHIDVRPTLAGKFELVALSDIEIVSNGAHDREIVKSQHNAGIDVNAMFREDTLIFTEAPLIE